MQLLITKLEFQYDTLFTMVIKQQSCLDNELLFVVWSVMPKNVVFSNFIIFGFFSFLYSLFFFFSFFKDCRTSTANQKRKKSSASEAAVWCQGPFIYYVITRRGWKGQGVRKWHFFLTFSMISSPHVFTNFFHEIKWCYIDST